MLYLGVIDGCLNRWILMINSLKFLSAVGLLSSQTTKKRSKRDMIGAES